MIHSFYINLDKRTDRREQIEEEGRRMGMNIERFPAIENTNPCIGCVNSHIAVLSIAKERKYESVLILEDDLKFLIEREKLDSILQNLPNPYDVVMLNYGLSGEEPYNEMFGKVIESSDASAYIVHSRFYDRLIETLKEGSALYEQNPGHHWIYLNDQYWKRLQPSANWYYSRTRVGKQRPGYSDLGRTFCEYN